ncbi:MAG: alpha-ketoacid dehydrogenase subunit beta [Deltaproteobacteria bacterium]|nr:alpha-ketoacid dehydrogenase subunit beta [Deltaproteobacteria bacterium]MBW2395915.1 alpha-ketoacid dehydrogenase subunit beta [Deltaproteobacteria bacterium]
MSRVLSVSQAINEALTIAMETDPDVILLGEDVAGGGTRSGDDVEEAGGVLGTTKGLVTKFGPDRVLDTPISEMGLIGTAVGAAATGLRPVAELMFIDFLGTCLDPLLNQAAKLRYMFGGKVRVPLTVRTVTGAGMQAAAQHSQSLYWMTAGIPGLKTVIPSNAADAKGLLLAAIRDDDPVIFCEPKRILFQAGEVPEGDYEVPIGEAAVVREGSDVSLIGMGATVATALEAAELLAAEGKSAEVLDLRSLAPLDEDAILATLEKTGTVVVVDESTPRCGIASDVAALCVDRGFDFLNAPVKRVTAPHAPVPYNKALEDAYIPSVARVIEAVRECGI